MSIALGPTPAAGASPPAGLTTAASGDASATGVTSQNQTNNVESGAVQVAGQSQAPVDVTNAAQTTVNDTAASLAQSGQAWAVAAGANGGPSNVSTPVTAPAPVTVQGSATGLSAQNTVSTSSNATVTVPGGTSTTPISLQPSQSVAIAAGSVASANSAPACSGTMCAGTSNPAAAAASPSAEPARASSGAADAQGVTAQNVVNTNANVSVQVHGQNFAPIQVVIDTVTQILNWGAAVATSGDTTATGGGAGTTATGSGAGTTATGGGAGTTATTSSTTTTAKSDNVDVTGATVQNQVDMRSSASVHVTGDNHSPIDVVLNLAADLLNWGIGSAQSGDAQATGAGGGGSAASGRASATGLRVVNLVNMWADASVDIDGNNYAPIVVVIDFNTRIRNYGAAVASSGNVAAGESRPASPSSPQATQADPAGTSGSTGATSASGASNWITSAKGGSTVAVANSADANITSQQVGSANGSHPVSSALISQLLHSLPSDSVNPLLPADKPAGATPTPQAGLTSSGGSSFASGIHTTLTQQNIQVAACEDPGVSCLARNDATMSFSSVDVGPNPLDPTAHRSGSNSSDCGICASGAWVGVNATPTPTAAARTDNNGSSSGTTASAPNGGDTSAAADDTSNGGAGSGSGGRGLRGPTYFAPFDTALVPSGHTVSVDLWDQWPGRRLPPMPNLVTHNSAPNGDNVDVSFDQWPGADQLPMPQLIEVSAPTGKTAPSGRTAGRAQGTSV
ncbi:MAG: hypothetical protein JOZ87_14540, partial [Chloroflexi bacterium]|nr:hypothetical protein [Chloroflexota bacterium]